MKKTLLYGAIIVFVAIIAAIGMRREAARECEMWKAWDKEYNLFEPSEQQKKDCIEKHGIDLTLINAAHAAEEIEDPIVSWYDYKIVNGLGIPCRRGNNCYTEQKRVAASREYERGTFLRVTNLRNGKWVIVQVTDYIEHPERELDLSSYAFSRIENLKMGLLKAKIEKVEL